MHLAAPLHRRPGIIAAHPAHPGKRFLFPDTPGERHTIFVVSADIVHLSDVVELLIRHADLLALVEKGQAEAHERNSGQHFFTRIMQAVLWQIAADTPRLIMVFDDIRHHSDVLRHALAAVYRIAELIRCDLSSVKPAVICTTEYMRGKIKNRFKTSSRPDVLLQLLDSKIK